MLILIWENVRLHREISLFLLLGALRSLSMYNFVICRPSESYSDGATTHGGRVRGQWTGWTSFSVASSAFFFILCCIPRIASVLRLDIAAEHSVMLAMIILHFQFYFSSSSCLAFIRADFVKRSRQWKSVFYFGNVLHRISHILLCEFKTLSLLHIWHFRGKDNGRRRRVLCVEMMMTTVMHISSSLSLKMAWELFGFICVLPHSLSQRDCRFIFGLSCLTERKNQVFIVARAQLQSVELSSNANVHYKHDDDQTTARKKQKTAHTASFGWRRWWWW